jgi:hypothetical protein
MMLDANMAHSAQAEITVIMIPFQSIACPVGTWNFGYASKGQI